MKMFNIDKKESWINKVFWIVSCVIVLLIFRFDFLAELLISLECLLIVLRFFMVRELREQRKVLLCEAEIESATRIKAAEAVARKRYWSEQNKNLAQQKKPIDTQSRIVDKSNNAQSTSPSIEKTHSDLVSSIHCASDIVKAQSVSFSRRALGNEFGLAEEMSKAGYRTVGDFYSDIQKIVTREIEIATVVRKFDVITNNDYLRGTLTRLLYAAALGSEKPKYSNLKPLALALRTIVESQNIVPQANGGKSSREMAELCSAVVVIAVAACQHGSASALMERLNDATLQFADEKISPDGPSTRRYVTALVLCFLAMVFETSKSISVLTDSLAGNRLVPIDINQLGSLDFDYLNASRPGWFAEVIANPEVQRAYLRHLRELRDDD